MRIEKNKNTLSQNAQMALEIAYRSAIFATKATRSSHAVTDTGDLQNIPEVPRNLGISPHIFQSSLWYHFETGFSFIPFPYANPKSSVAPLISQFGGKTADCHGPIAVPTRLPFFSGCRCRLVHSPQEVVDQLLGQLGQPSWANVWT